MAKAPSHVFGMIMWAILKNILLRGLLSYKHGAALAPIGGKA
jgi:hypothetical protein